MSASLSQSLDRRLSAFHVTGDDLGSLATLRDFAASRLPGLIAEEAMEVPGWPEVTAVLRHPEVHRTRVAHWQRLVAGRIDDGFIASASHLGQVLHQHGLPIYGVSLCAVSVLYAVSKDLGLDAPARGWPRRSEAGKARLHGALSRAVWLHSELLLEAFTEAALEARKASLRTMAERVEDESRAAVSDLAETMERMIGDTVEMAGSVASLAEDSQAVRLATEKAQSNVQTVAAATEELGASIREISRQITGATGATQRATEFGTEGRRRIATLAEEVHRIGGVARLIADIAGQTNLLALNATIEAARAGEAGKGFAVVAGEVKSLAAQTAKATEEISRQVQEVANATNSAVAVVRDMAGAVAEVDQAAAAIAAAMEQQSSATEEIARAVTEASTATGAVTERIGFVSERADAAARKSTGVRGAAEQAQSSMDALNQALNRIVREAAPEVERRAHRRMPVEIDALLFAPALGAEPRRLTIIDLSRGGCRTGSGAPSLPQGTAVTLRVPAQRLEIAAQVTSADGPLRLRFRPDAAAEAGIDRLLAELDRAA